MSYKLDTFLKPLSDSDKNLQILDNNLVVKWTINPFTIKNVLVSNNLLKINLNSDRKIIIDFSTTNEAKRALELTESQINILTNKTPLFIDKSINKWVQSMGFSFSGINNSLIPSEDSVYDLGSTQSQWRSLHVSGSTIYLGGVTISTYNDSIVFNKINLGSTASPYILSSDGDNLFVNGGTFEGQSGSFSSGDLLIYGQTISSTIRNQDITFETHGSGNFVYKGDLKSWVLLYGINLQDEVWGSSICADDDGNLYVTGGDYSSDLSYVLKCDSSGNILWQKSISIYSFGESIVHSNGRIFALLTEDDEGGGLLLIELNTDGDLIDQWSFDASSGNELNGYEISTDEDSNIYYCGYQYNDGDGDMVLGKLNTTSQEIDWNYKVGFVGYNDKAYSICVRGDYVYTAGSILNNSASPSSVNISVSKFSLNGTASWSRSISLGLDDNYATTITVDSEGYIYVAGYHSSGNFYFKLDSNGSDQWIRSIDNQKEITCLDLNPSEDSLFLLSTVQSYETGDDLFIVKIDSSDGDILWQKVVGSVYDDIFWHSNGHRGLKVNDTDVFITGFTEISGDDPLMFVINLPSNGGIPDGTHSGWTVIESDYVSEVLETFGSISGPTWSSFTQSLTKTSFTFSNASAENTLSKLSPPLELKIMGNLNINDNYTLPSLSGMPRQVLTPNSVNRSSLEWSDQSFNFGVNDFESIENLIQGTSSLTQIIGIPEVTEIILSDFSDGDTFYIQSTNLEGPSRSQSSLFTIGVNADAESIQSDLRIAWDDPYLTVDGEDGQFIIVSGTVDYYNSRTSIISESGITSNVVVIQGTETSYDDSYVRVDVPFPITFMGVTYSSLFIGSNSYVTFGSGSRQYSSLSKDNPAYPGIFISSADRSYQRVYKGSENGGNTFRIRYEGSAGTGGTPGEPDIVWEMIFYNDEPRIDVHIDITEESGLSCIKDSHTIRKTFTPSSNMSFSLPLGSGIYHIPSTSLNFNNGVSFSTSNGFTTIEMNGIDTGGVTFTGNTIGVDIDYEDLNIKTRGWGNLSVLDQDDNTHFQILGTYGWGGEFQQKGDAVFHGNIIYRGAQYVDPYIRDSDGNYGWTYVTQSTVIDSFSRYFRSAKYLVSCDVNDGSQNVMTCEITLANSNNSSTDPVISVYGVSSTSGSQIVTFDVARNTDTDRVELYASTNAYSAYVTLIRQYIIYPND